MDLRKYLTLPTEAAKEKKKTKNIHREIIPVRVEICKNLKRTRGNV